MAKKSKNPRANTEPRKPAAPQREFQIGGLALLGMALTLGLLIMAQTKTALPYCSSGSSCDLVQSSRWSTLFGLPITVWGFIVYSCIAAAALVPLKGLRKWRVIIALSLLGVGVSIYLNVTAWIVIDALCAYCTASLLLLIVITLLALRARGNQGLGTWRIGSAIATLVFVGLLHLHFSGLFDPAAGPEDPYLRELAIHLHASGAKFYGAYWCPHCQQQKSAFGASARRLPYVECSPNGQSSAPATACISADIKNYPTWIFGKQRLERTMTPGQLARYSRFKSAATQAP